MNKKIILLYFSLLAVVLLYGCQQKEEPGIWQMSWEEVDNFVVISENIPAEARSCSWDQGFCLMQTTNDEDPALLLQSFCEEKNEMEVPEQWKTSGYLYETCADAEGNLCAFLIQEMQLKSVRCTADFQSAEEIDLSRHLQKWLEEYGYTWPYMGMDGAGMFYFWGSGSEDGRSGISIWAIDREGSQVCWSLFLEDEILYVAQGSQEGLLLLSGEQGAEGTRTIERRIGKDGKELFCHKEAAGEGPASRLYFLSNMEDLVYLWEETGLWCWSLETGQMERLFLWDEVDFAGNMLGAYREEDGTITAFVWANDRLWKTQIS